MAQGIDPVRNGLERLTPVQKTAAPRRHADVRFNAGIVEITAVRDIQTRQGGKPCFMTAERLFCKKSDCEWRRDCRKLVAVWKR